MGWVYLDDGFYDHPKAREAGAAAVGMYAAGLCYTRRYGTAGRLPKSAVSGLVSARAWRRLAERLVAVNLWEEVADAYLIHDYAEWNRPQMSRSEAGKIGAQARWKHANRNATASANRNAMAYGKPPESHLTQDAQSLTPPYVGTSSSNSRQTREDEEEEELLVGTQMPLRVVQAIDVLARRDLVLRSASATMSPVVDVEAWLRKARERRTLSDGERLCVAAVEDPAATPDELAGPEQTGGGGDGARHPPDPLAGQREAAQARMAEGMAQVRATAALPVDPDRVGHIAALRETLGGFPRRPPDPAEDEF